MIFKSYYGSKNTEEKRKGQSYYDALKSRMDADGEEEKENKEKKGGNTRLPYGLCKEAGIGTKGMTPKEAWEALETGTGVTAEEAYESVEKEGDAHKIADKVEEKAEAKAPYAKAKAEMPSKAIDGIKKEIGFLSSGDHLKSDSEIIFGTYLGKLSEGDVITFKVGEKDDEKLDLIFIDGEFIDDAFDTYDVSMIGIEMADTVSKDSASIYVTPKGGKKELIFEGHPKSEEDILGETVEEEPSSEKDPTESAEKTPDTHFYDAKAGVVENIINKLKSGELKKSDAIVASKTILETLDDGDSITVDSFGTPETWTFDKEKGKFYSDGEGYLSPEQLSQYMLSGSGKGFGYGFTGSGYGFTADKITLKTGGKDYTFDLDKDAGSTPEEKPEETIPISFETPKELEDAKASIEGTVSDFYKSGMTEEDRQSARDKLKKSLEGFLKDGDSIAFTLSTGAERKYIFRDGKIYKVSDDPEDVFTTGYGAITSRLIGHLDPDADGRTVKITRDGKTVELSAKKADPDAEFGKTVESLKKPKEETHSHPEYFSIKSTYDSYKKGLISKDIAHDKFVKYLKNTKDGDVVSVNGIDYERKGKNFVDREDGEEYTFGEVARRLENASLHEKDFSVRTEKEFKDHEKAKKAEEAAKKKAEAEAKKKAKAEAKAKKEAEKKAKEEAKAKKEAEKKAKEEEAKKKADPIKYDLDRYVKGFKDGLATKEDTRSAIKSVLSKAPIGTKINTGKHLYEKKGDDDWYEDGKYIGATDEKLAKWATHAAETGELEYEKASGAPASDPTKPSSGSSAKAKPTETFTPGTFKPSVGLDTKAAPYSLGHLDETRKKWQSTSKFGKEWTQEYRDRGEKAMQKLFADNELCRTFKGDYLEDILNSDFKSLVEVGHSGGSSYVPGRKDTSHRFFGTPKDAPKDAYEKYGFLGNPKDPASMHTAKFYGKYGSNPLGPVTVVFDKDKMKGRVTYTFGDSLNHKGSIDGCGGVGGENATWEGMAYSGKTGSQIGSMLSDIENGASVRDVESKYCHGEYIECQYHGKVTFDDVKEIYIEKDRMKYLKPEIRKRLEEKGIAIKEATW